MKMKILKSKMLKKLQRKILSEVKDKNTLEESNKNFENLLKEKDSQIEKLNKDYENTQKNLEEQKKIK